MGLHTSEQICKIHDVFSCLILPINQTVSGLGSLTFCLQSVECTILTDVVRMLIKDGNVF